MHIKLRWTDKKTHRPHITKKEFVPHYIELMYFILGFLFLTDDPVSTEHARSTCVTHFM